MYEMKNSPNVPISPTFDLPKKTIVSTIKRSDAVIVPEIDMKLYPTKVWNPDAKLQISTEQWLNKFGLKASNLDSSSLYPRLGFARLEGFNEVLKKPIHSRYGDNLFPKHFREDGLTFNVVAKKEKLLQVQQELENAIQLYQQRLEWLSSESRRLFGVIEDHCVTIIIDIKNKNKREFDQFICAIERFINEQVRYIAKFNLIRVQEIKCQLSNTLLPVSKDNLANGIDWLWQIDRTCATNSANLVEALIRASNNKENEAIYLITEDLSSDGSREVLREKVKQLKIPLNIISYNCKDVEFISYLKCLVLMTGGRFHSYLFNLEIDAYESSPLDSENPKANLLLKKKIYGGSIGGIGTRNDCVAVFSEIEEARALINQIKSLINQIPEKKGLYDDNSQNKLATHIPKEEYMSSQEWLAKYGLISRKLDFYDVLSGVCFRHCDGVVDVLEPPPEDKLDLMEQQNATLHQKLINAKYCDKFAHVKWKDGSLVHVQMSSDVHRLYSQRMKLCLLAITRRIEWLRQGSRELFGTIMEDQVYILIDVSASMEPHISFVKDKLYTLIQEQLRHKTKINFVAFNTKALPWRDRLVDVTEGNLKSAWQWLEGLNCQGSTNTLAALQFAIKDRNCQGIYLLTDGRPDQPTKTVLSQIRLQYRLPIHTISFNCADLEANKFLCELARETGGRFHYFNEISGGADCTSENELEAWESEDIKLLKSEYRLGFDSLEKVTKLRDECHKLAWKSEVVRKKEQKSIRKTMAPGCNQNPYFSQISPSRPKCENREIKYPRPIKAKNTFRKQQKEQENDPIWSGTIKLVNLDSTTGVSKSDAYQSFLEALSSRNENEQEWVIDETQEIIDRQTERYKKVLEDEYNEAMAKKQANIKKDKPKNKDLTLKQWLHIYGLVPQHMTILDALAPTIVKVRPKYVPIIDRYVMSKVFEEILPISHVVTEGSPKRGYKPVVRLVNPLAVDLKAYQEKLENLMNKYRKKLRKLIQVYIGDKTLNEFDEMLVKYPLGNDDVKMWVMKTFTEANWPINEEELEMFMNEIYIAQKYFIQAGDLLRIRGKTGPGKAGKDETPEFEPFDAELRKTNDPFSTILLAAMKGATILAPGPEDGFYYDAQIINWPNCDFVDVQFNMFAGITSVSVPECVILPNKSARLTAGMTSLVKVYNMDNDRTFYLPGIINSSKIINPQMKEETYHVTLYNGLESTVRPDEVVAISKENYQRIVKNIEDKMANDTTGVNATSMSASIVSFSDSRKKTFSTAADITNMKSSSKLSTPKKRKKGSELSGKSESKILKKASNRSLPNESKSTPKSERQDKPKIPKYSNLSCAQIDMVDQKIPTDLAQKLVVPQNQSQTVGYPNRSLVSVNDPVLEENILISQNSLDQQNPNIKHIFPLSNENANRSQMSQLGYVNENIMQDIKKQSGVMNSERENENNLINLDPVSEKTLEGNLKENTLQDKGYSIFTKNYKIKGSVTPENKTYMGKRGVSEKVELRLKTSPLSTGEGTTPILIAEQFSFPLAQAKFQDTHTIPDSHVNKVPGSSFKNNVSKSVTDPSMNIHLSPDNHDLKVALKSSERKSKSLSKEKISDEFNEYSKSVQDKDVQRTSRFVSPSEYEKREENQENIEKEHQLMGEIERKRDSKKRDSGSLKCSPLDLCNKITSTKEKDKSSRTSLERKSSPKLNILTDKNESPNIPGSHKYQSSENDLRENEGFTEVDKRPRVDPSIDEAKTKRQFSAEAKAKHLTKNQRNDDLAIESKEFILPLESRRSQEQIYSSQPDNQTKTSNSTKTQKNETLGFESKQLILPSESRSSEDPIYNLQPDKPTKDSKPTKTQKHETLGMESKEFMLPSESRRSEDQIYASQTIKPTKTAKPTKTQRNDTLRVESKQVIVLSESRKSEDQLSASSIDKKSKPPKKHHRKRDEIKNEMERKEILSVEIGPRVIVENYDLPENDKISQTKTKQHQEKKYDKSKKSVCTDVCLTEKKTTLPPGAVIPQPADVAILQNEHYGVYNIILTPTTSIVFPQTHAGCKTFEIANVSLSVREIPGTLMSSINKDIKSLPTTVEIHKTYSYSSDELCKNCKLPKVPFGPDASQRLQRSKSS